MRVEMRVYRQFDLDLYAIGASGYSLSKLLATTVSSFANGNPVYILMDELNNFSLGDKTSYLHFCFIVDNRDLATINLMKSAAPRMRTSLCKMILRNALGQQDLRCFFPDFPEIDRLMAIDANKRLLMSRPDTIPLSRFRVQKNVKDYAGFKVDMGVKDTGVKRNFNVPQNPYQQYNNPYQQNYQNGYQPRYMPQQGNMNNPTQQNGGYPYMPQADQYRQPQPDIQPMQERNNKYQQRQRASVPEPEQHSPGYQTAVMPNENIQPPVRSVQNPSTGQQIQPHVPSQQNPQTAAAQPVSITDPRNEPAESVSAPGTVDDDLMNAFDNL